MTVTYTAEVATVRGVSCFLKLLRRWRGSIYKLVWLDLLVFLIIYYALNFMYRFGLDQDGKELFESVVKYCNAYGNLIPISFVLGFYVTIVMTRWWNQYTAIPFPDSLAVFVSATVHGADERGRVMRRTVMRYVCLSVAMMFTMISPRVKKRFPTLDRFVEAGLLQESEKVVLEDLNKKFPAHRKYWLPIVWAASIITRARKEGRMRDDFAVKTILDELNRIRGQCGLLLSYDSISVPLVYTQVVTLAVYSYFVTTLMGQQWVEGNQYKFDLYFPVFTTLQFFFYVGWLKVAESLINPFGDDDDDFEVNWMVDRNIQVSYLIVDEMHHEHPELVKDQYWDEVFPQELPYPTSSERDSHPLPSTANIAVQQEYPQNVSSSYKDDLVTPNDMQSGPITFMARSKGTKGSQASMMGNSVPDSMSRVNSVANIFKRFLSRENSRTDDAINQQELAQINVSKPPPMTPNVPKNIAHDIIEEVDEQLTITSLRDANETARPSVFEAFGPPAPSKPIDVPTANNSSMPNSYASNNRSVYDPFPPMSSSSVPPLSDDTLFREAEKGDGDNISIGESESDPDEFSQLKKKRDEERLGRLKISLLKSLSPTSNNEEQQETLNLLSSESLASSANK